MSLLKGNVVVQRVVTKRAIKTSFSCHHHHRNFHATPNLSNTINSNTALVIGSSGALGSTIAKYLSQSQHLKVIGADVHESSNENALDDFIPIPHFGQYPTLAEITERLAKGVEYSVTNGEKLNTLIVASGGWQMDPVFDGGLLMEMPEKAREYGESMETMMRMNFYPVAAAGFIAQEFMAPEGLFVVMGATAALQPTPGMIGYGVSKAAAHQFVQTLGATTGLAVTSKALRKEARQARRHAPSLDSLSVIGILPTMLDTPNNRASMPDGNFDEWTKPIDIAKEISTWISTPPLRPHSGSLVKVFSNKEGTHFQLVR